MIINLCRVAAVLLLLVFGCHCIFIYHVHSESAYRTSVTLRSLFPNHDDLAKMDLPRPLSNQPIDSSIFRRVQHLRTSWLGTKVTAARSPTSTPDLIFLSRRAAHAALLVVSCALIVLSCVMLVESFSSSSGLSEWFTPLRIASLIIPAFTTLADLAAMYLHAEQRTKYATQQYAGLKPNEIVYGTAATTHRLLYAVFPVSTLLGWVLSSSQSTMLLDSFQLTIAGVAVLIPAYLIQTGNDDW